MTLKNYPIHKHVIKRITKTIAINLYDSLIQKKSEIQNKPQESRIALSLLGKEKGGDEADKVSRLQEEEKYANQIQRNSLQLKKILLALKYMENGEYGLCQKTGELINLKRLQYIPWTTLSIEGAEIEEKEAREIQEYNRKSVRYLR